VGNEEGAQVKRKSLPSPPVVERCFKCPNFACCGTGYPLEPCQRWFCLSHAPADFFPLRRLSHAA
jgi:hypothetical protein